MVSGMSRSSRARLGLVLGGLVLGLGLAELGARMLAPHDAADLLYSAPDNAPDGLYITDTELFSLPSAGFEAVQRSLGYAVHLRINSHGLRGGPVGDARPRWLAAGDSFTMAAQVSEKESFVGLLSASGSGEVLNGGVDGHGTWQALRRYERLDDSLGVDGLLLVFFAGNDLADNARWELVRTQAAGLSPGEPIWRPSQGVLHRWLYPRSVLYARLHMLLRSRELAQPDSPERQRWANELLPFTQDGRAALKALIRQTEPALAALRASTEARGDRLVVAIAPPAFQIESARREATMALVGLDPASAVPDQVTDAISEALAQKGIASCDLVGPLRAAHRAGERLYLAYDGHWSPAGHRVVARALAGCIDDR
jgi:hypothetical protein